MSNVRQSNDLLIVIDNPQPMRLLIALPFFIGGGYFLYHLLDALYDYINNASAAEWLGALPGMLVMLLFAALISFPGLFLAARESVVVNRQISVIGKRRELFGLHTRGKIVDIDDVEMIICRQTTKKHTHRKPGATSGRTSSVTVYPLDLEIKNGDTAPLIEYSEKAVAKNIARVVSDFSGLALVDRL